MSSKRIVLLVLLVVIGVGSYKLFIETPPGPRSLRAFDPDRTADLEVDMWKVYYEHRNVHLFNDLVTMMHEQYRYTWFKAGLAGFHLARAASGFATTHSDYEQFLPDLEAAYTIARDWTGSSFDPKAVANAELAWWVARRIDGKNSPEQVGGLIADENALIFNVPRAQVLDASVLRARAGRLRDDGGENADWNAVSDLLHQSYRKLHEAVNR